MRFGTMASRLNSVALLIACQAISAERFEAVEPHMGSMVRIVVYAANQAQARKAFEAAFARVAELDGILSDYKSDSELNRLCFARSMVVSRDLFRVIEASQRLADESDGAFDISAGPLIRLWRDARKRHILPGTEAIELAHAQTGWRKLTLDSARRRVTLTQEAMQLDVGGIAKGYVADETLVVLKRNGIDSALVGASGDIAVSGAPPGTRGWDITVELLGGTHDIQLCNEAVSTAGDTEQFLELNGTRYSHIIDPKTGMALTRRIAVSVIAPTGLEADGLDTAISVLGPTRGLDLMKRHPKARALIVSEHGVISVNGWPPEPRRK